VLWRRLAAADRDGAEVAVNFFLATPLLIVLVTLLLWFPSRLSYFYWVYRLDLLAVPFFVAFAVLIMFGATALWRARWAIALLLFGWPPILDSLLRLVTARASSLQASALGLLPLPARQLGDTFAVVHDGKESLITIAAPCSGMLAVLSMLFVGVLVVAFRAGSRRRKLAWLATAVALAFAANVIRLALVVTVAAHSGVAAGFAVFHALAGPVLFAVTLVGALLLLAPFGLTPRAAVPYEPRRVELPRAIAATLATSIAAVAILAMWSTTAVRTPGLFRDVVALDGRNLLPLPDGFVNGGVANLASLGALFGGDTQAQLTHIDGIRGDAVAAQVVVTSSYRRAQRYNVLDCFVFHHAHVYSTHVEPLVGGGSAVATAVRIDSSDIATLTWVQPVLVDDRRAWRRVVLLAYLDGTSGTARRAHVGSAQHFGAWLLDRFGPYGATAPPKRFRRAEQGLVGLADQLVRPGGPTV
jgi:exosortase